LASSQVSSQRSVATDEIRKCYNKLDLDYKSTKQAFKGKKTRELIRGMIVLPLCSVEMLRKKDEMMMVGLKKILGQRLFRTLLRLTFFGQFVGGETVDEVKNTMIKLKKCGVKSILDYCVEADISPGEAEKKAVEGIVGGEPVESVVDKKTVEETRQRYTVHKEFGDRRKDVVSARTYFYESEAQCDRNCDVFCASADAIASAVGSDGINCIKLTALGRPQLLLKLTELIAQSNNFYKTLIGSTWEDLLLSKIKKEEFLQKVKTWLKTVDFDECGFVDFYDWGKLIEEHKQLHQMFQVMKYDQYYLLESNIMKENMKSDTTLIIEHGKKQNVRIMIDAEQTYFQPAISRLTMAMMRKYNKKFVLVFNTYQAYLKNCLRDIELDLHLAQRENFHFGCKVVRGAYMEQERKRAKALNYEDPINPNIDVTADMYRQVVQRILRDRQERGPGSVSVMIATHNEETIRHVVEMMVETGISPSEKTVCFAQLYGMCDQVSYSLGQAGYSVYKYVPYGPIEKVLPYLSRRAQENGSVFGKVKKEVSLLFREVLRRILTLNGRF
uniref:Proline dehydrogenase n=1 Tax=Thelazia callipaeda TaxID=103827 RepID=A0A0N5CJF5_THECL